MSALRRVGSALLALGMIAQDVFAEPISGAFRMEGQRGQVQYAPDDERSRICASEAVVTPHIV